MKKLGFAIGMLVVLIGISIGLGIMIHRNMPEKIRDVSLKSEDGKVTFTFEKVIKGNTNWQPGQIGFVRIDMENFYSDYIENSEYYLYTVQAHDNYFNEVIYVMLKEGYYFFVESGDLGVTLYDGLSGCYTNGTAYYMQLPFNENIASVGHEHILFEESLGISSYEDLLEFYGRLDESMYEANDEEKVIYLSITEGLEKGWIKNGAKITVTETGFDVELMPKYVR